MPSDRAYGVAGELIPHDMASYYECPAPIARLKCTCTRPESIERAAKLIQAALDAETEELRAVADTHIKTAISLGQKVSRLRARIKELEAYLRSYITECKEDGVHGELYHAAKELLEGE